jgi:hypothetical protein
VSKLFIENRTSLPVEEIGQLLSTVASHTSMKHALDWLLAQSPPLGLTDMVTQDEFSHDFLIALPGELWLVYDST